jgi:preprotein translocase subunit SecY
VLSAFVRAFRTPDLRRKLLFTIGIMVLFRVGSFLPTPGVSYPNVQTCIEQSQGNDLLGLVNLFSGGALLQLSVFALGIMPYITASIIVQLLRVVIPRFEELHKEGQSGTAKLTQYTRYLTDRPGGPAVDDDHHRSRAAVSCSAAAPSTVIPNDSWQTLLIMVITMTGRHRPDHVARRAHHGARRRQRHVAPHLHVDRRQLPGAMWSIAGGDNGISKFIVVLAIVVLVIALVVFVEQSQRRSRCSTPSAWSGRRMYGGSSTYIPIKINMAGVIPVIFASSLLAVPGCCASSVTRPRAGSSGSSRYLASPSAPAAPGDLRHPDHLLLLLLHAITFNPDEVADNMKKYGGFIPASVPGGRPAEYLDYVISRITAPWLGLPGDRRAHPDHRVHRAWCRREHPFGGAVDPHRRRCRLETVKQIESQLQQRHYEGFLR